MPHVHRSIPLASLAILLAACGILTPEPQVVKKFEVVSGDKQTARIRESLPRDLVVRALDSLNVPVPGVSVTWSVSSEFGSIKGEEVTDPQGYARASWKLGTVAGEPSVSVTSPAAHAAQASFTAIVQPGPIARVRLVTGNLQSAVEGTVLRDSLVIAVSDSFGNAIPGTRVDWKVLKGGGTMRAPSPPVTDRIGQARASWQVGIALPNTAIAVVDKDTIHFQASPGLLSPRDTVRLASGLKYLDIRMTADTSLARSGRIVGVAYSEYLVDGTLLQRVRSTGDGPLRFVLGAEGVIPGFNEGVTGMRKGSVRRLVVPPEIGYNDDQIRIYDVELTEISGTGTR